MAAGCGSTEQIAGAAESEPSTEQRPAPPADGPLADSIVLPVTARAVADADPLLAGEAITAFGTDLFAATRAHVAAPNLTISPASVAIAYGMLEPGAVGDGRSQLHTLFRITDPAAYHASMNALETDLENRIPEAGEDGAGPGELTVRIANATYLQEGYPFTANYLEAIGSNYGPVLNEVNFWSDPDAVARTINAFVAEETNDRITELIAAGTLTMDTKLVLVNALYLDATWARPFDETRTASGPFTTAAGAEVPVDLMYGTSDSVFAADGWIGATKAYNGGLYAQFILPDEGRFNEVADNLDRVFQESNSEGILPGALVVPRFEIGANMELDDALQSLGLEAIYRRGNLTGVANDPGLFVFKTIHETYLRMDEAGTEGAAATAVAARNLSSAGPEPLAVVLNRPFLYRIVDSTSGATLFLGQVTDPTA